MNKINPQHEIIVSGIHLVLTPALKAYVQEKMERLFRHEDHIVRVRVELESDSKQVPEQRFTAKGHIQLSGPDKNAQVTADDCYKAIDLLTDTLDRMLRRRARSHKVKRKQPHAVEWDDVELPKAV